MINDDENTDIELDFSPSQFASSKLLEERSASFNHLRQQSFQYMHDGFSIVDANGIHVDVNRAFCEMTGFSEGELIGSGPEPLYWPPEDRERIQLAFAKTLRAEFADVELVFMRKNGERFPVIVNPFAITDQSGAIIFYAATVQDITQRVKLQSALQESEQRYRGLFESAADAIVILQGEKIVDVNERALKTFGVASIEQLMSRASFDFFPPLQPNGQDSRKFSIEKLKAARSGKPQFFAWHHVKLDGTLFDAEVSLSTFKLGETTFIQAIIRDITQRKKVEDELKESEQRFRTLFESAGDAIMILENDQIIDCNERTLLVTGRSREEILSKPTADYFPATQPNGQDSREFFSERVIAAQSGVPQSFEWTGQVSDGRYVNQEITLTSFMHGNSRYTQSIMRDITQRKQLEESLRLSEQRYRNLFESAGDGILILQGELVLDCNERVLEIYGLSREQLMGLSNYSLSPPTQPNGQCSKEFFAEKIDALQSENPQIFQWTGNKLDGTTIETEVTLTTFMVDGIPFAQSIIRDITHRKQLEGALRDSEVRFRALFENAGDAISLNKDSRTIDCNKRLSELYGIPRDDILSAAIGDYFPSTQPNGQDSREFYQDMVNASRSGNPRVYEWHGRKPDGTPIITEVTLTTLILGGEMFEQAIARDITQRKQMEAALVELNMNLEYRVQQRTDELEKANADLLQQKNKFRALAAQLTQTENEERKRIAMFLHDNQQQLLVAAKFKAEMLQNDQYDFDVSTVGQDIVEILEQTLEVSRSLTMELAPPILYGAGFVAAMQWLAGWMEEHHQLRVQVIGSLPVTPIPADVSNLLFRAVRELLFNVSKHSGVAQACVSIVAFDQGLRVAVIDDGCGFNVKEVLLTPRSYGLFSIQEQLASLDGRLDITSVPQSGTICNLSIPLATVDILYPDVSPAAEHITTGVADTRHTLRRPVRILVADDHALARAALVQILGQVEDFDVVGEAVDGLEAVEKAGLLSPDVVLMDMTMPRLDGLAATRRITTEIPGVKVIGLSMHAKEEMQPQLSAAGAICYLQKSTPVDELIVAIRGVMNNVPTGAPE